MENDGGRRIEGITKCRGGLISILVLFIDVLSQPHSCPLLALSLLYRCAYTYVVAIARSLHARASEPAKTSFVRARRIDDVDPLLLNVETLAATAGRETYPLLEDIVVFR